MTRAQPQASQVNVSKHACYLLDGLERKELATASSKLTDWLYITSVSQSAEVFEV